MSRKIEVQILGDSKSLEAALGRASQKTSTFGKTLAVGAKAATGALVGLGAAAVVGFKEMTEHQKVAAQTAAVIKSTGGAANVTAKQVDQLSASLLNKSGVDDEVIASGENVLLTFRNIQNEAGKGNDIFNQATQATLDLSVALGKDMTSSAILVGKALNDPEKGLTALTRAGVQFSDAQTKVIKHLVKTGQTAKAQKIILGELTAEFGGSAAAAGKTLSGQLNLLQESFKNVAGELVTQLMPAFKTLVGTLSSVVGWMKQNQETTKILVLAIAGLSAAVITVNAVYKVWSATTKVVAAAQWLLNAALAANPVVLITAAVIAFGIALVIAYKKSETFRNVVSGAIDFVKRHWQLLLALIPGIGPLLVLVARNFKTIRNAAGSALDFVVGKVQTVINIFKTLYGWIQDVIGAIQTLASKIPSIPSIGGPGGDVRRRGVTGLNSARPAPATQGSAHVNVYLDGRQIHTSVANHDRTYRRQNGRSAFA